MGYYNDTIKKWIYKLDSGDNGIYALSDGSFRAYGSAIVYDDIWGDVLTLPTSSWWSTYIERDEDENTVIFYRNGDVSDSQKRINFNIQLSHNMTYGSNSYFKMHLHWWQISSTMPTFELQYRIQYNGSAKTTSWTTLNTLTNVYSYSSGTLNQLSYFEEIDISGCGVSDTIQFRLARTDSYSMDIHVTFIDAHVAIDSDGSRSEWVK